MKLPILGLVDKVGLVNMPTTVIVNYPTNVLREDLEKRVREKKGKGVSK